ncbi:MAG: hypothetical protein ACOVP8_02560, partial [Phycisphaerales bacterium]
MTGRSTAERWAVVRGLAQRAANARGRPAAGWYREERGVAYQLQAFAGVVDEAGLAGALAQQDRQRPLMEKLWG